MKKFVLIFILFVLTAGAISAQQLELKDVIVRSARGIEGELPQKAKIALLNFESPTKTFSDYVLDELTSELLEAGKVTVVDRKNITAILNEMKFQYSGYVSDESMVSIGKMIGVQYIISGTLTDMETFYRFRIRIINVETAVIQRQITNELKSDNQVAHLLGGKKLKAAPTSNIRNNWFSGEVSGGYNLRHGEDFALSVGARYERMLNPYVSLGVDFYNIISIPLGFNRREENENTISFDKGSNFGVDASIRFYPTGGKFFFGIELGYYDNGNRLEEYRSRYEYSPGVGYIYDIDSFCILHGTGFAITAELGWKIDVGKEGGFFVEPGFLGTFIIGNETVVQGDSKWVDSGTFMSGYWRGYLGIGWAF
jgi:TolB-like protein